MEAKKNRIRVAVQRKGRLSQQSLDFLVECGIDLQYNSTQLYCQSQNFPLDLLLVRDDDIPYLISSNVCEYGIVGSNVLTETHNLQAEKSPIQIIKFLNFANCRLSLAVPNQSKMTTLNDLDNKRIATSYPNILNDFMRKNNLNFEIIVLSGSVEIAPSLGMADAICDLVSTGNTLRDNNLKEIKTIFHSQAVLIKSNSPLDQNSRIFQNRVTMNIAERKLC